uniref:Shroom family member 3 n=1 Tax=Poecilia formosa TaxID=48698 RepID=A0A096M946_POEFO
MERRGRAGLQPAGGGEGGGWVLVEARLQGGAPWGFTVQGGLEHGQPLIISKVEEGGKADSVERPLLVGDELIIINDVELSGYRQEAIALIKGSFKTLQLTVRRKCCEILKCSNIETPSSNHSRRCSAVQLRIRNRHDKPKTSPVFWHKKKLHFGEGEREMISMVELKDGGLTLPKHDSYPSSASTTDLSAGFDPSAGYLRKSPDQYSSRGSMESLDPAQSSHHHPVTQQQSNSIDLLHSKRDSAYSSFSTSSSIPEYLASTPSFGPERSCSLDAVPQRGAGSAEMLQADIRYVRAVYDAHQGLTQEQELNSSRTGPRSGPRDLQGSVGGVCYRGANGSRGGGVPASNRHSVGPIWGQAASRSSYESLKGAPAPPRRSDSYAAIRNHERPNSWSSLDHARSLRSLQSSSWHHSSGPVASAKASFGAEGQLHTVMEKSPESSPTTKPRQGAGFSQPPSPTGPSSPPSRLILPAGVYPVPQPEPQYAQTPSAGPGPPGVFTALTKESSRQPALRDDRTAENGHQGIGSSPYSRSSYSGPGSSQLRSRLPEADSINEPCVCSWHQQPESNSETHKPHLKTPGAGSEGPTGPHRPYRNLSQNLDDPLQKGQQEQNHRITPVHSVPDLRTASSQENIKYNTKFLEPAGSSRVAQGQVPPHPSAQWSHRDPDSDHPLTRLEIALAEVQRCAVPDGPDGGQSPARSLSVLEKVSHFERRRDGGKQRSFSTNSYCKSSHLGVKPKHSPPSVTDKGRSSPCGAEDLRNMLERSTKGTKTHRTMSYRGSGNEYMKHRYGSLDGHKGAGLLLANQQQADPVSALQRSRSSFQLDGSKDGDVNRMFGASPIRSYRDSVKDAQPNVLRSASFRQRDLSSPPPVVSGPQPFPNPAKYNSLEKKGPKTKPKPQGIVMPPVTSPHTPKERHAVSPDDGGQSPPPLPSVPPVGPPALTRICGRKRLTADQKKRSYSEPENMNEVGVSDPETAALFRRGGVPAVLPETSVADRRKMFELAASHVGAGVSRSDLRQLRQDALVEYMERKRGVRRDEAGQRTGSRPRSAYFHPEQGYHTDTYSLSSASSMLSLQDPGPDQGVPALGSDRWSLQSNLFYPAQINRHSQSGTRDSNRSQDRQIAEPQYKPGLCTKVNEALQRVGSVHRSGRSASAEDLLERLENKYSPQHIRSRSSPTADKLSQLFVSLRPADIHGSTEFSSQSNRFNENSDRPTASPQGETSNNLIFLFLPLVLDVSHTPVSRRERQRNGERLRAYSTSTLAASVGLPSPFSSPGNQQDGGAAEWTSSERLSQANLDAITFPGIPQTGGRQTRRSLSDGTAEDEHRGRTLSLELTGEISENTKPVSPVTSAPPPCRKTSGSSTSSHQSVHPHLSSLRISESSLFEQQPLQTSTGNLQEFDDVFLTTPIKETSIMEDFPPLPPPPPPAEMEADLQSLQRFVSNLSESSSNPETLSNSVPIRTSSAQSAPPLKPSNSTEDVFVFQYQPLPRREKSPEELRVEALTQQLVLQDPSLAPLLDTWGGECTMKLMEEIFSNGSLTGEAPGSSLPDQTKETDVDEDENDVTTRKGELCEALRLCVAAMQREKAALAEEQRRHQAAGAGMEALIQQLKANEKEKYSMFIGDLERIVNLLLSLCSRLSRVDKSLLSLDRDGGLTEDAAEERDSLHHKRSLLLRQTEDARELKENLDRRQRVVTAILTGYLTEAQLHDYRRFVSAKPSLLIRQRQLDDLIRQREEQLARLAESLPPSPAHSVRSTAVTSL